MNTRVLLVDDHRLMREGLRGLLEKEPDIEVIAEAKDGQSAIAATQEMLPDVVVMDVAMPDLNGIEATRRITAAVLGVKVIALSMHSDNRFVLEMLKAGASGYLLKDCASEELISAIRTVVTGRTYLSPSIADSVVKDYIRSLRKVDSSAFHILTDREREVLQLMAEGKATKEIARQLSVSVKTIETHRQQIMRKLNIHSIAELTKYAIREGMTSLET